MFTLRRGAERLDAAIAALPPERRAEFLALVAEVLPTLRRYRATFDAVGDDVIGAIKDLVIPIATAAMRGKGAETITKLLEHAPVLCAAVREVEILARRE